MAFDEKKYLNLAGLTAYDAKIKEFIGAADTAGDAATLKSAKEYADGLAVNYDAAGAAATVQGKLDAEVLRAKAAEEAAQAAADAAQDEVDALEVLVGTLPAGVTATTVVGYIQEKTSGIASEGAMTELAGRVTAVEGEIDAIQADYLKAADKTELSGLITAEATTARAAEKANADAIAAVVADYLKAADKTALQGAIDAEAGAREAADNALSGRLDAVETFFETAEGETLDAALDTLVELQKYLDGEGKVADQMLLDIAANKAAIEKEVTDRGTAVSGLETAYKAADEALDGRIATLEGKFEGDDSVAEQIASAVAAEKQAREAADTQLGKDIASAKQAAIDAAAADATTKAGNAETAAKGHADSLNTAMNTRVEALEAIDHTHSNKTDLDAITAALIEKWNAAVQSSDVVTGTANGTISVKGTDVAVKGLGSAAYTDAAAYDVAGAAAAAETAAKGYADTQVAALEDSFVAITTTEINALFQA